MKRFMILAVVLTASVGCCRCSDSHHATEKPPETEQARAEKTARARFPAALRHEAAGEWAAALGAFHSARKDVDMWPDSPVHMEAETAVRRIEKKGIGRRGQ